MNQLLEQIKNYWTQMDTTRRFLAVVVLLLFVISMIFVIAWGSSPHYELLYSHLGEQDRSEIISKLDEMKVPYRTTPGGGLEVPNALSVRASLLTAGIPRGGVVGWEIFDKSSFSATDFTNQINRQRAIAGELTRTLQRLDGIVDAKILLNIPDSEEYLFAESKPEGTASVQLQLRGPGILTEAQVEAIANLVAASTGLKNENVTIIDNYANDLTAVIRQKRGNRPGATSASGLFAAKTDYETQLEKRLESMLAKVFGYNKSVVRVNAELDLDYQEVKSETFGNQGVPRSEQEKTETTRGTGSGVSSGPTGTDSNITTYKSGETGSGTYSTEKSERTTNYEISKTEEFRIKAPGNVKRLTVGVWVDGDLPASTRQKIVNTIGASVGIVEDRGDKLTVETTKFTPPPKNEIKETFLSGWDFTPLINPILIAALFIVWLFIIRKIIFPKHLTTAVAHRTSTTTGVRLDTLVTDHPATREQVSAAIELSPEEQLRIERLATIEKIAQDRPAEVAILLKAWLAEE